MTASVLRRGPEITAAELHDLLRLRVDVFVVEQQCPYPEIDGADLAPTTRHLWVPGRRGVDGCLRVLVDPVGVYRIGRVCTAEWARGTGLGARLMREALDEIGAAECVLDAQTSVTGFYTRFGFHPEGDEFDEDGIPHIMMRRR